MATRHLITGATGATGGEVVRLLLEAGACVRALAHREDERSRELQRRGAEVVYGDFLDFDAVRSALAGVDCAYFCYPISPGIAQAAAHPRRPPRRLASPLSSNMSKNQRGEMRRVRRTPALAQRARVRLVRCACRPPSTDLLCRWLLYLAPMIRQGLMLAPFSTTGRHAPIAAEDQARVIVGMFAKPDAHAGKTYPLFGPVELTHPQIAQIVGRVLRKEVKYQQVTMEKFMEVLQRATAARAELGRRDVPRSGKPTRAAKLRRAAFARGRDRSRKWRLRRHQQLRP